MSEPVFVITPIGGADTAARRRADDLFELVIEPVIAAINADGTNDLAPVRSDKIERPGSITDAIVDHILKSKVVIVDLSGLNPNVLYEMGIADSFGIPTVRLSDDPGSLPFDAKDHNAIELVSTDDGSLLARAVEACKVALKAQLTHALADDFTPTSIVVRHAKAAQLDSLATNLGGGDEQDKALAAVLEKLSVIEDRLGRPPQPPLEFRTEPLAQELLELPIDALALLAVLAGVGRRRLVEIRRETWDKAILEEPRLRRALDDLILHGLVNWKPGAKGVDGLRITHQRGNIRMALDSVLTDQHRVLAGVFLDTFVNASNG